MITSGDTEIKTINGDFPISFFGNKKCEIWNGESFSKIRVEKVNQETAIFKYQFGCSFTYDGMKLEVGVPFETHIWCDEFRYKDNFGNIFESSLLETGEFIKGYSDDNGRYYKCFYTCISEMKKTSENLFFIPNNSPILANDLLIYS